MLLRDKNVFFFDLDGLLLDTESVYFSTRQQVLQTYGYPFTEADNQAYVAKGFKDTLARLQKLVGDKELGKQIFSESIGLVMQALKRGDVNIKPGARQLLTFLQQKQKTCYITSAGNRETIQLTLQSKGLEPYFEAVISGEDVAKNKPAPDVYIHALAVTGSKKAATVVFEDSPSGVLAASAAGLDVILVPDRVRPSEAIKQKAVACLSDLATAIPLFQ